MTEEPKTVRSNRFSSDRLIEAGWLTAIITTPLHFDSFTFRSFEPDKVLLLRSVALIMAVGWTIKALDCVWPSAGRSEHGASLALRALAARGGQTAIGVALLALAIYIDQALATAFSIAPELSFWGSYQRQQGLVTSGAYVVVFLSVALLLRTRAQFERAVTTMLLASCPAAVYGLIQYHGLDPVLFADPGQRRVVSTLGNPIFMAGFLILTVPLALYRLVDAARSVVVASRSTLPRLVLPACAASVIAAVAAWWGSLATGLGALAVVGVFWVGSGYALGWPLRASLAIAVYATLAGIEVAAILLSESRGPFLGLLTMVFFFALFGATARGKWQWNVGIAGGAVLATLAMALVSVPHSPLGFVRELPVAGRLSSVFETGGTARVRLLVWEQSLRASTSEPTRMLVGYGPETVRLALAPHYSPELGTVESRDALPDRAHNETYDRLISTGLIGLVLYYALVLAVFQIGLRSCGVLTTARTRVAFLVACVGSGVGLALIARLGDQSWRLLGIFLPLGFLLGMAAYLVVHSIVSARDLDRAESPGASQPAGAMAIAAFLAAIAGHLVEIHFGIATVSTETYFWVLAALAVSAARSTRTAESAETETAGAFAARGGGQHRREFAVGLAVICLIVLTLGFDFTSTGLSLALNTGFAWLFAVTAVLTGLLLLLHAWPFGPSTRRGFALLEFVGFSGSAFLASLLVSQAIYVPVAPGHLDFHPALIAYFATVLVFVGLLAFTVPSAAGGNTPSFGRPSMFAFPVLLGAALWVSWQGNLKPLQADVLFKRGWIALTEQREFELAVELIRRALALAPDQDYYHTYLGRALSEQATASQMPDLRDRLFTEAEASLREAARLDPREPDHPANLARLYASWARISDDPQLRAQRVKTAIHHFRTSMDLSPARPKLWNECGMAHASIGEYERALAKHEHALSLDPTYLDSHLLLAKSHVALKQWDAARKVLEHAAGMPDASMSLDAQLALVYERLGRLDEAVRHYEGALRSDPMHDPSRRALIRLYVNRQACDDAVSQALTLATLHPEDDKLARLPGETARACQQAEAPAR